MNGIFKLRQDMIDRRLLLNADACSLYLYMLANADADGTLQTTSSQIERVLGLSRQRQRTLLSELEATNKLTKKATNKSTKIRLCGIADYDNRQPTKQPTKQPINQPSVTSKNESKTLSKNTSVGTSRFVKPTIEEIQDYINEKGYNTNAQIFFDYYESIGWMRGKNKMKDWRATLRTWERNSYGTKNTTKYDPRRGTNDENHTETDYGGSF